MIVQDSRHDKNKAAGSNRGGIDEQEDAYRFAP
jgi:hypothetical protein